MNYDVKLKLLTSAKNEIQLIDYVQELLDKAALASTWCDSSAHWSGVMDELVSEATSERIRKQHAQREAYIADTASKLAQLDTLKSAIRTLVDPVKDVDNG